MSEETITAVAAPSNDAGAPGSIAPVADRALPEVPPLHSEHSEPRARENGIPHSRVKEMVSKAEERVRQEYAERIADFERRIAEYEGKAPAAEPTPEPSAAPSPEPRRERIDFSRLLRRDPRAQEREAAMRAQYEREARVAVQTERFHLSWNAVRDAHQDILDMPGASAALRAAALNAWRTGGDPIEAARAAARPFQHQQAMIAQLRDARRSAMPRISHAGYGAGAPSTKPSGSIAQRIGSRLAGRSGDGY